MAGPVQRVRIAEMPKVVEQNEAAPKIRLLLADNQAMFRAGIRLLFEGQPDMQVVGESGDGQSAVRLTRELKPDLLLLDMDMADPSGMEVLRELRERETPTRTLVLSACIERNEMVEAIQLGARGVVTKQSAFDLLAKAVRSVMAGEYWVDRGRVSDLAQSLYQLVRESSSLRPF